MDLQTGRPRPPSGVFIIHFGIICCAVTIAIAIAVALMASG